MLAEVTYFHFSLRGHRTGFGVILSFLFDHFLFGLVGNDSVYEVKGLTFLVFGVCSSGGFSKSPI